MANEKRVLVVDDMDYWRERACAIVATAGHTAVQASSSREAISLLDKESFDLIITDTSMEVGDAGIRLLEHEWNLGREVPSILCSAGILTGEQEERLKKLPHAVFVPKATRRENPALLEAIQNMLS